MKKKLLSFILAALLLSTSLISCSDNKNQNESGSDTSAPVSSSVETESQMTYLDEVPDTATFGGQKIRYVAARDKDSIYVDLEDEKGTITDIVEEAVWRRNNIVQDRLDIEIVFVEEIHRDSFNKTVMNSINSNSDDYDVFVGHQRFQVELAAQGVMKNLNNLNYIDTTKPYWAGDYIENLSYKDSSYWITGDMVNSFIGDAWAVFVNTGMWNIAHQDLDIYSIVKEGKWTIDKLSELIQDTYNDANGDGKAGVEDKYGLYLVPGIRVGALVLSADAPFTAKDSDGVPYLCVQNEHSYNVFEKIHSLMYKDANVINTEDDDVNATDMFVADRVMFMIDTIETLSSESFRDMESDYYVIPLPKYDEEQENYITTHYDGISVIGIPITVNPDNVDAIAATLEVTSSVSHEISLPAYYDGAMKNKYSRDPGQAEMIDIIHDTITGDFCHIYGDVVGLYSSLYTFWGKNIMKESVSSILQKNLKLWETALADLLVAFEENSDN